MALTIGITNTEASYHNYPVWMEGNDKEIHVITLDSENKADLEKCDGIVLSGGVDTHPRFYGNNNFSYPNAPQSFNEQRDEFELAVFQYACKKNLPVLAICRGMQLVNIALGGDMIQDIEAAGKANHRKTDGKDGIHEIAIAQGSLLWEITGSEKGLVNSAHHQGLGKIAPGLLVNAWAPDGIAEGVEWENKTGTNFLLGVQWHPERLTHVSPGNLLSIGVRERFLAEVQKQKKP